MIILSSLYSFKFASSALKRLILVFRVFRKKKLLFIPSAVVTGFYQISVLTCLFDLEAQTIFQW